MSRADQKQGEVIFYDVNRSWLPREAITVMNAVGDIKSWFEQPCETLEEIAHVRRHVPHSVGVDEGLHTMSDLIRIHAAS